MSRPNRYSHWAPLGKRKGLKLSPSLVLQPTKSLPRAQLRYMCRPLTNFRTRTKAPCRRATVDSAALTARLKPRPFKTAPSKSHFQNLVETRAFQQPAWNPTLRLGSGQAFSQRTREVGHPSLFSLPFSVSLC